MQQKIHQLMQKEMSRKDFLTNIGLSFGALLGISAIFRLLAHGPARHNKTGYGSSPYGGHK